MPPLESLSDRRTSLISRQNHTKSAPSPFCNASAKGEVNAYDFFCNVARPAISGIEVTAAARSVNSLTELKRIMTTPSAIETALGCSKAADAPPVAQPTTPKPTGSTFGLH